LKSAACRAARAGLRRRRVDESHDILHRPQAGADPGGHHPQRLVHPHEIEEQEVERLGVVVLKLLAIGVRQPGEAAMVLPSRKQ
jgi:hypothetical protein